MNKSAKLLLIPQGMVFARNLLNQLDMGTSYLGGTSVKIQLPLSSEL
jgi:hypothetical protein